jgi:Cu/Ag efflux pump CusA
MEVLRPVAYSTAIIIAVFAPLLLLSGFEGKMFVPFAFTVIVSMLVGFALSITVTPLLCYMLLGKKNPGAADQETKESWLTRRFLKAYERFCCENQATMGVRW